MSSGLDAIGDRARDVYERLLAGGGSPTSVELEAACTEHPELASDLRRLDGYYREARELLSTARDRSADAELEHGNASQIVHLHLGGQIIQLAIQLHRVTTGIQAHRETLKQVGTKHTVQLYTHGRLQVTHGQSEHLVLNAEVFATDQHR